MRRYITMPGRLYIESCGTIVSRGEVKYVGPEMHAMIDTWLAQQQSVDLQRLRALRYSGLSPHSYEAVALCRRLVVSGPESAGTLVYAHRGHHSTCKTPLLQSLLAPLAPHVQVQGLRVEHHNMPLDILLSGIASLGTCGRCVIVKDNAVRLGTADVASVNTIQYLALSRSCGRWAVKDIVIHDAEGVTPAAPSLSLDMFLADPRRDVDSLCLVSRTMRSCPGFIHIERARETAPAAAPSVRSRLAKAGASNLALDSGMSQTVQEGIGDA